MDFVTRLQTAMQYAVAHKPAVGGFPFLAECLRQAGVQKNIWSLPAAQSIYVMDGVSVVSQGEPLVKGLVTVPAFDEQALVTAVRTDQAGESTFLEFLMATWQAGVVGYEVDFLQRTVRYCGAQGEEYTESYPEVEVIDLVLE